MSLHSKDAEQPVVGKTRNLSSKGMCVFITPTPPVGQELTCELPNGKAVQGRVAWATEPDESDLDAWRGIGIEFADRAPVNVSEIAAKVGAEVLSSAPAPVDVWFDGLESSTRAIASRKDGAVELSSTLAFLREGSEVRIAASKAGEPLRGRVANVFLRNDGGTPRLVISLALSHEVVAPPAPGDERWFPEISIDEEPVNARSDEPTASLESAVRETVVRESSAPELIEPDVTERNPAPDLELDGDTRKSTLRIFALGTVAVALALWAVMRSDVPAPIVEPVAIETAAPVAPVEVSTAAPVAATENAAAETPHAEFASAELKRKDPKPAEAPVEAAAPVAAAPVAVAPMVAAPTTPAHVAPTTDTSGPGWLPQVVTIGDKQQITVPLGGTGKGISRFLLDSPPGIAVDLPAAFPVVPMKSYLLHDPAFYSLWIRKQPNGNGLQIRLHVTKGVHVSAEIVDGKLRFKRKD